MVNSQKTTIFALSKINNNNLKIRAMNTIKTFIPSESVDAFKKFAEKTKRNVEGFDYTISNPRKKLFRHAVVEDCQTIIGKYWHDICDLTIKYARRK